MAEMKTSRKALKTKKQIMTVLAELLAQKELRDITVQEIADRAEISRTTFYNYYLDVYDIYEQMEKTVLTDFGLIIAEYGEKPTDELYPAVFRYIVDNPEIFKMIFSPNGTRTLYLKLLALVEGLNRVLWAESFDLDIKDKRVDCVIRYHSNGCLAIVEDWVMSDFALSQDFIVQMLAGLDESTQAYLKTLL